MTTSAAAQSTTAFAATLDAQWDFDKPALSEERFRAELAKWPARVGRGAGSAHADCARARPAAQVRRRARAARRRSSAIARDFRRTCASAICSERGRTFNSSGAPQRAVPLFAEALPLAETRQGRVLRRRRRAHARHRGAGRRAARLEPEGARARGGRDRSTRPRLARIALQQHRLDVLRRRRRENGARLLAKGAGRAGGDGQRRARSRVAKWTVARGYRGVGRLDDAEAAQKSLARRVRPGIGETDGYVYEELAEIALARGDAKAARPWAAKAHAALKDDPLSRRERGAAARAARRDRRRRTAAPAKP